VNLISASGIGIRLGGRSILQQVDIDLQQGEMLGLIGPNGAGKSTLLKILSGILQPDQGRLTFRGQPFSSHDRSTRARHISYLSQQGSAHWPITVRQLVALGRLPHLGPWQRPGERDRLAIEQAMQATDLLGLAARSVATLSGGEKARVLLARALAGEPAILLADEPVAALDPAHQLDVMTLLRRHCDAGGAVVVVLHDLHLAAHFCDRLQLLHQGMTLETGPATRVLSEANLQRAYGIGIRAGIPSVEQALALAWERRPAARHPDPAKAG